MYYTQIMYYTLLYSQKGIFLCMQYNETCMHDTSYIIYNNNNMKMHANKSNKTETRTTFILLFFRTTFYSYFLFSPLWRFNCRWNNTAVPGTWDSRGFFGFCIRRTVAVAATSPNGRCSDQSLSKQVLSPSFVVVFVSRTDNTVHQCDSADWEEEPERHESAIWSNVSRIEVFATRWIIQTGLPGETDTHANSAGFVFLRCNAEFIHPREQRQHDCQLKHQQHGHRRAQHNQRGASTLAQNIEGPFHRTHTTTGFPGCYCCQTSMPLPGLFL